MPRKNFIYNPENSLHITCRCINRDWFAQKLDSVWSICEDYLFFVNKVYNLKIHSFVLMKNHYHLLAKAPDGNLSEAMRTLNHEISRNLLKSSERINLTFGRRFFRTEINDFHHFTNVYKYVYRNPVEANICSYVENYKYSTLHGLLGFKKLSIPLEPDNILFDNNFANSLTLKWLNTGPNLESYLSMKKALSRRGTFTLPRTKQAKPNPLNTDLY